MNRRSFLGVLGLSPIVVAGAALADQPREPKPDLNRVVPRGGSWKVEAQLRHIERSLKQGIISANEASYAAQVVQHSA